MSISSAVVTIPTICGSVGAPPPCALALAGCSASNNANDATDHKDLPQLMFDILIPFDFLFSTCFLFETVSDISLGLTLTEISVLHSHCTQWANIGSPALLRRPSCETSV